METNEASEHGKRTRQANIATFITTNQTTLTALRRSHRKELHDAKYSLSADALAKLRKCLIALQFARRQNADGSG